MKSKFSMPVLEAAVAGLNGVLDTALRFSSIDIDEEVIVLTRQEALSAIVIHLFPDGSYDKLNVGTPSAEARREISLVCQSIAREWRRERFPVFGVVAAATDCLQEIYT